MRIAFVFAAALTHCNPAMAQGETAPLAPCLRVTALNAAPVEAHRHLGNDFAYRNAYSIFTMEMSKIPASVTVTPKPYSIVITIKQFETSGYIGFAKQAAGEVTAQVIDDQAGIQIDQHSVTCVAKAPLTIASPETRIRTAASLCLTDSAAQIRKHIEDRLRANCTWRDINGGPRRTD